MAVIFGTFSEILAFNSNLAQPYLARVWTYGNLFVEKLPFGHSRLINEVRQNQA